MTSMETAGKYVVSEYMETFHEWCAVYGLMDPCIEELRAAVLVESERQGLTASERDTLRGLADLIEQQRRSVAVK